MKNKILRSDIILILLIIVTASIVLTFADLSFKSEEKVNRTIDVYKAYNIYDQKSNPISLTYQMIEMPKNGSKEVVIEKIFKSLKDILPSTTNLINVKITDNIAILNINEDLLLNPDFSIVKDCLVNSITEIDGINQVKFELGDNSTVANTLTDVSYNSNISKYYINSPIQNKLKSFLFRDENYQVVYQDLLGEKIYSKIVNSKNNYIEYSVTGKEINYNEKRFIKRDGLYIDNVKILSNTYMVDDTWSIDNYEGNKATALIKAVELQKDNTLLITIEINVPGKYTDTIKLKQGLGTYSTERKDIVTGITKANTFVERIFVGEDK